MGKNDFPIHQILGKKTYISVKIKALVEHTEQRHAKQTTVMTAGVCLTG